MQYVLASASPRRKQLLGEILTQFCVIPAQTEERVDCSLPPEQIACALAEEKCNAVAKNHPCDTVIGCDTIVVFEGKILGKPKSCAEAEQTLTALSGKTHTVITGVCVRCGDKKLVDFDRTEVRFNALTPQFIHAYVAGGSPMDKAGSYGIQDEGVVQEYVGSFTNVVGLPVNLVKKMLKEIRK